MFTFTANRYHGCLILTLFKLSFIWLLYLSGIVAVLFCGLSQARYTVHNLSSEGKIRTKQVEFMEDDWGSFHCFQTAFSVYWLCWRRLLMPIFVSCVCVQGIINCHCCSGCPVGVCVGGQSPAICLKGWAQMETSTLSYCTGKLHRGANKSEVHTDTHLCIYYSLSVPQWS